MRLRRGVGEFEPAPDAFERVLARRDRKQRNGRVAAGALGIAALFALVINRSVRPCPGCSRSIPAAGERRGPLRRCTCLYHRRRREQRREVPSGSAAEHPSADSWCSDDFARVCSGDPSTTTGPGGRGPPALVFPCAVLTCDDGSEPETLSGPPARWSSSGTSPSPSIPRPTPFRTPSACVWRGRAEDPSPAEAAASRCGRRRASRRSAQAQELADAGDPRYTWQVDPPLAGPTYVEAPSRGLEDLRPIPPRRSSVGKSAGGMRRSPIPEGSRPAGRAVTGSLSGPRRAGRTPPIRATRRSSDARRRLDELPYETVNFIVTQLGRHGPSGIWVVTGADMCRAGIAAGGAPPLRRRDPLRSFRRSSSRGLTVREPRIDDYPLATLLSHDQEVPILYATSGGSPYQRYRESIALQGPVAALPAGSESEDHLFAETPDRGRADLRRRPARRMDASVEWFFSGRHPPTWMSSRLPRPGSPLPVPYRFLDGEVTFDVAPRRTSGTSDGWGRPVRPFHVHAFPPSPRSITVFHGPPAGRPAGCEPGPAPADAEALARSIALRTPMSTPPPGGRLSCGGPRPADGRAAGTGSELLPVVGARNRPGTSPLLLKHAPFVCRGQIGRASTCSIFPEDRPGSWRSRPSLTRTASSPCWSWRRPSWIRSSSTRPMKRKRRVIWTASTSSHEA